MHCLMAWGGGYLFREFHKKYGIHGNQCVCMLEYEGTVRLAHLLPDKETCSW